MMDNSVKGNVMKCKELLELLLVVGCKRRDPWHISTFYSCVWTFSRVFSRHPSPCADSTCINTRSNKENNSSRLILQFLLEQLLHYI